MSLVAYPDSDEDENELRVSTVEEHDEVEPQPKRRRVAASHTAEATGNDGPPPLPAAFHDLYAGAARVSSNDDPELHGGRKRAVPHVEGNWAAHIYLEWFPPSRFHGLVTRLLDCISSARSPNDKPIHSLLSNDTHVPQPLHISLSAPLVLRAERKDDFLESAVSSLQGTIRDLRPALGTKGALTVYPRELSWVTNTEGSRSFLVLRVGRAEEDERALGSLLAAGNRVAKAFDCAELYVDRGEVAGEGLEPGGLFHVSIAWSLDVAEGPDAHPFPQEAVAIVDSLKQIDMEFNNVKVKLGKTVTSVPFARGRGQTGKS